MIKKLLLRIKFILRVFQEINLREFVVQNDCKAIWKRIVFRTNGKLFPETCLRYYLTKVAINDWELQYHGGDFRVVLERR